MDERIRYLKKIVRNEEMYERLHSNNKCFGTKAMAIHYVRHNPSITQDELSIKLGVDKALTTRLVKALEAEGLIERKPDSVDKRKKRLYPTTLAESLKESVVDDENNYYNHVLSVLDENELEEFLTLLTKIYVRSKQIRKKGSNINE